MENRYFSSPGPAHPQVACGQIIFEIIWCQFTLAAESGCASYYEDDSDDNVNLTWHIRDIRMELYGVVIHNHHFRWNMQNRRPVLDGGYPCECKVLLYVLPQ